MVVAARAGQQKVVLVKKVEKNDAIDLGHDPDPDLEVDPDARAV